MTAAIDTTDVFGLYALRGLIDGYRPPETPFDPDGAWRHAYDIHFIAVNNNAHTGRLVLERKPLADGLFELQVEHIKFTDEDCRQTTRGRLTCRDDALATPLEWNWTVQLCVPDQPELNAPVEYSGAVHDGRLVVRGPQGEHSRPIGERYTTNWSLFDAVQRHARDAGPRHRFDLIDHFDQLKPEHEFAYRSGQTVRFGGREVPREAVEQLEQGTVFKTVGEREGDRDNLLHAFGQIGRGVVPWVYFTDERQRLVAISAGIEGYMLREA